MEKQRLVGSMALEDGNGRDRSEKSFLLSPFKGKRLPSGGLPGPGHAGYNTGPAQLQCIHVDLMDVYNISCLLARQTRPSPSLEEHSQGGVSPLTMARHVPNFPRRIVQGLLPARPHGEVFRL